MIEHVQKIGQYYQRENPEKSSINAMVKAINSKDIEYILLINIQKDDISYRTVDFYQNITFEALFYQAGRAALGGGIRLDYYLSKDKKGNYKGRKKLMSACKFCEVEERYEEIETYVEEYLKKNNPKTFAVIQVDGKMPQELFTDKFLKKMYSMTYNEVPGKNRCHICGKEGKTYNTATFKFYTNDKGIYHNINKEEQSGFVIGEDCLNDIIIGKEYIEQYLSTYWSLIGEKIMLLPHNYNEDAASIFESTLMNEDGQAMEFVNTIRLNEEDFLDCVGKTNSITDILFYQDDSKFFYIDYQIQSILPSRFSYLGDLLKKYSLKLYPIIKYATAIKVSLEEINTTKKEKMRMIDAIFTGKKIDRNLFFKRVTNVYKFYYLRNEHKKFRCIDTINRIYNFLCECSCLEGKWNVLKKDYKNYNEFFEENQKYFNLSEKKAWFILGKAYSTIIYYMRGKGENNGGELDRTSLEKNFFFARKFDFNDFIYFSNLIEDKMIKYKADKTFLKKMLCEAKEYMANRENKLSNDEAKYIFFWGMDSYFDNSKETEQIEIEEVL